MPIATPSILDSVAQDTQSHGLQSSLTIGADGLGIISYRDRRTSQGDGGDGLSVAHCNNRACTSATLTTLDGERGAGDYSSITIDADGLALIGYYDADNDALRVAHCADRACLLR